jgi:hypothetical protein
MPYADLAKAKEYRREYYHRPHVKARVRLYEQKPVVKEKLKRYQAAYWLTKVAKKLGVSRKFLDRLVAASGGKCEICGENARSIDHEHARGHVRGVLCKKCNTALGLMRDRPDLLRSAALYLEQEPPRADPPN